MLAPLTVDLEPEFRHPVTFAMWTFLSYLEHKDLRATLRQGSLVLGLIGVIATFVSAPIDDFSHETFGRDSVHFSPPHTLGLFAIFALVGGVLLDAPSAASTF